MLRRGPDRSPEDVMTPEEEIKDPFLFEFLELKDEYSEYDLEAATTSPTRSAACRITRRNGTTKATKTDSARRVPIDAELLPLLCAMRDEAGGKWSGRH